MWKPGIWELVIILVIVLLVFGVGRLSKLGKDLGEGISEFRRGLNRGQQQDEGKQDTGSGEGHGQGGEQAQ
jgi:sec-independent protein translocase protein TatA